MLSLEAVVLGEGQDGNEEHERGVDGGKRANNSAHPVVNEDVHLVDGEVAEDTERGEDRRKLENEVVAHPHRVPSLVIPRIHIHHGSDAWPAPEVPTHDRHVSLTQPDEAEKDGRAAQLSNFFIRVDTNIRVDTILNCSLQLSLGRVNVVQSASGERNRSENIELLLHFSGSNLRL